MAQNLGLWFSGLFSRFRMNGELQAAHDAGRKHGRAIGAAYASGVAAGVFESLECGAAGILGIAFERPADEPNESDDAIEAEFHADPPEAPATTATTTTAKRRRAGRA